MTQMPDILRELAKRRRDLRMPVETLATRAGVSARTTRRILAGNPHVAFASVLAVADALGMRDLSHGSNTDAMRQRQARQKAKQLVKIVQGTSALEGQAVDKTAERHMVARTVTDLLNGPPAALWA